MRELETSGKRGVRFASDLVSYLNGRDRFGRDDLASGASRKRIRDLFRAVNKALEEEIMEAGYVDGSIWLSSGFARLV
jgi:hypothetical protein